MLLGAIVRVSIVVLTLSKAVAELLTETWYTHHPPSVCVLTI